MRHALPAALLVLLSAAGGHAQDIPVSVQFRFVVDCSREDASPAVRDEKNTGSYCLADRVIVSDKDIERAELTKDAAGVAAVLLVLTDKAAQRLLAATQTQVGHRLGVVINSRLVVAPLLREPIGKEFMLSGQMTAEKAQDLVQALGRQKATR